jgi:hypothetical protein
VHGRKDGKSFEKRFDPIPPDDRFLAGVNDVLMSSAGSLTNPNRLANHIASATGKKPDPRTVGLMEFLLNPAILSGHPGG